MKKEDLMKGINGIDDEFIEEYAVMSEKKPKKETIKLWQIATFAACVAAVIITVMFSMPGIVVKAVERTPEPTVTPSDFSDITVDSVKNDETADSEKTEAFILETTDDSVYIRFDENAEFFPAQFVQIAAISFRSLADMKETLKSGKLSKSDASIINTAFPRDENGKIIICDPDKLYQPVLPDGTKITRVDLDGYGYGFFIESEEFNGVFNYYTKDTFDSIFKRNYVDYFNEEYITVKKTSEGTYQGLKTEICDYSTEAGNFREIRYNIELENKTLVVNESYNIETTRSYMPVSSTVPYCVDIYFSNNDVCFEAQIHDIKSRPTIETLSCFGITEYSDLHE